MLYGYFARVLGRQGGLLIAILAPMSPMWLDKATAAEIDMMQVMWVTGAILCLLRAIEESAECGVRSAECEEQSVSCLVWTGKLNVTFTSDSESYTSKFPFNTSHSPSTPRTALRTPHSFAWWLLALLCVAGGALTKWTGPAFFYATAIPLLWWRGQLRLLWSWRHLAAAAIGASICLAWIVVAISYEGWDAFYATVKREALQRMLPEYAPHTDPWYVFLLHPVRLWYTNLPWSLVALLACRPSFGRLWDERGRMLWQALHCWIWPNILIWSFMLDHKPRHSFPLFPAVAGLAAMVWLIWLRGWVARPERAWKGGRVTGSPRPFRACHPATWSAWTRYFQPRRLLVAAVIGWLITKFVFVQIHMSQRYLSRDPQGKAAVLAALVPHGCLLYLFKLKDEGIMFYYGRPVLRLPHPGLLPSSGEPLYCILGKQEWERWRQTSDRPAVPLTGSGFADEQGDPMVLVRVD
jgi:4-amino-4-deoxy-L-arabinose transferase-like glycosyltransferase